MGATGYTIQLPPAFRYQGSYPNDPENLHSKGGDYFSNEEAAGPLGLSQKGIGFSITASTYGAGDCVRGDVGSADGVERKHSVVVDGNAATLHIFVFRYEPAPAMVLDTFDHGNCFNFVFITVTVPVRDAFEPTAVKILESFHLRR